MVRNSEAEPEKNNGRRGAESWAEVWLAAGYRDYRAIAMLLPAACFPFFPTDRRGRAAIAYFAVAQFRPSVRSFVHSGQLNHKLSAQLDSASSWLASFSSPGSQPAATTTSKSEARGQ